jgi:hypothetical protein
MLSSTRRFHWEPDGNCKLVWWYITRPYLGMSLALVFYAVLRGGFVVGSPADAKVVNPFGVLAIGAPGFDFPGFYWVNN